MSRLALRCSMLIAGLCVAGCREQNDNFCTSAPHTNCMNLFDAPIEHCMNDQQCAPNICDLTGSKTCVQCTISNAAACTATTPVCGTDNACHGCTAHAECSSNVCIADGSCAAEANVAYVAGGQGGTCGKADPCGTLDAALQTGRPFVKFAAGLVKDNKTTTIDGKTVTILAEAGAKLDRDGDGALLVVQSSSSATTSVQIFDLEITGATGVPGGDAVRLIANGGTPSLGLTRVTIDGNQGIGVASTGGSLTVSQSTFSSNQGGGITASQGSLTVSQSTFSSNQGGGISEMSGTFSVVGNAFFNNGGIASSVGGIAISTTTSPANRLEFNSFNQNVTQATIGPAIHCIVPSFAAKNNIMSDNGTLTLPNQFGGSCSHTYSIARPGTMLPGSTNSASDPLFVNPTMGDLHLQAASPARHAADPGSDLTAIAAHDIDGTPRVSPADLGAYEYHP